MDEKRINRFNVYEVIALEKGTPEYRLEIFSEKEWNGVFINNPNNLEDIANKIIELFPEDRGYIRLISEERALDKREGILEGITFYSSGLEYCGKISREKFLELGKLLDKKLILKK